MGLMSCPICTDQLVDQVVATSCGHVFHNDCLESWLKNNRSCPMCKSSVKRRSIIKLFINTADESIAPTQHQYTDDEYKEAYEKSKRVIQNLEKKLTALQHENDNLQLSMVSKDEEIAKLSSMKTTLEKDYRTVRLNCSNMKTKMTYLMEDAEKAKKLQEKLTFLERQMKSMRAMKAILDLNQSDCEEVVRNTVDADSLRQYLIALKKEYSMLQKTKTSMQEQLEDAQKKLSYSKLTVSNLKESLENAQKEKDQIEKDLSNAERINESISKKIGLYEDKSIPSTGNLLNLTVNRETPSRYLVESIKSPLRNSKRARKEQSTPILFEEDEESFESITKELQENLDNDDDLEVLAAELGVDVGIAETPTHSRPNVDHRENNLFSKVGFDGLGGVARIKKPITPSRLPFKQVQQRKSNISNFFRRL